MAGKAFCARGSIWPKKSSPKRMREISSENPSSGLRRKYLEKRSQSVCMAAFVIEARAGWEEKL
jgi:hypothetical protein